MHCILRVFGHKEPTPHARKYGQIVTVIWCFEAKLDLDLFCDIYVLQLSCNYYLVLGIRRNTYSDCSLDQETVPSFLYKKLTVFINMKYYSKN